MREYIAEALQMVDAFANVGVKRFSVTQTNIQQKKVNPYWPGLNVKAMQLLILNAVPWSWERSQNLILRPHPVAGGALVQLDDLDLRKLEDVRSRAFLTLETSPGNYQAWLFVEDASDDLIRRMVRGMDVDWKASRAVRVAGTPNCKPKYLPSFPVVRIDGVGGKIRLDQVGDWIPPVDDDDDDSINFTSIPLVRIPATAKPGRRAWPIYAISLAGAPKSADGGKQRSSADFTWCCTAADWGWSAEEIARKLMEVSTKAKENGWEYARKTAEAAASKVARNGPWRKR